MTFAISIITAICKLIISNDNLCSITTSWIKKIAENNVKLKTFVYF